MYDQATELRQLVRQRGGRAAARGATVPLITVAGGKGGVGATTIAANLAVALARQGRRAVFVDADLDHGGQVSFCGGTERGSILDVLAGRRSVHEALERGPSGIQVIAGGWASGEVSDVTPTAQDRLIAELGHLGPHADVVVVDAGSGRTHFARRLWQAAAALLVVATVDSPAVMNTYAAIKTLARSDAPLALYTLTNLVNDADEALDVQARIAEACRKFLALRATAAGAVVPCESSGPADGVLIFPPRGDAARSLDRVADTLWAQLQLGDRR
ncbi:MAG: MinD/ParA family protein [Pirellulales bacterium]